VGNLTSGTDPHTPVEHLPAQCHRTSSDQTNTMGPRFGNKRRATRSGGPSRDEPPYRMYQFWVNTDELRLPIDRLKVFTFLTREEIE